MMISDIFTFIVILCCLLYIIELIVLTIGLQRASKTGPSVKGQPYVSVIIAARNEEDFIEQCLASIIAVDYPKEKLEIIAVDDGSTDRTEEIMRLMAERHPNFKILHTGQTEGNLRGKVNALTIGIESSQGEILMFTDADCRVPESWVRETVSLFDDETGIVGGYTLLDTHKSFEGMQALDWFFLFSLAASGAGLGVPLTVIGNNLSVRKEAYELTGGFRKINFSVTEDYALVRAILRKSNFKVKFPLNPGTLIKSKSCSNLRELYRQKKRWGIGGLDMIFLGMLIMAIGYISKLLLLTGLFLIPFHISLFLFCLMLVGELLYLSYSIIHLRAHHLFKYFPLFFIYLFIYVLSLPLVVAFSQNVVWKSRTLPGK